MLNACTLKRVSLVLLVFAIGCGMPNNHLNLFQRSMVVQNAAVEQSILAKASIETAGPNGSVRILHLKGTPYEMGFQHGVMMKPEIQELYRSVVFKVKFLIAEDMLDEAFDLMEPYIPIEDQEEMRGLAHGADVPLRVVHWLHAIPEISEYGPKKRFRKVFRETSCSNVCAFGKATKDGKLYSLRVLDWIRDLGAQKYPVILVHVPDHGNASVTFSYAGFIGGISGMNDQHMTFGEMGYGDPPNESLEGTPYIFLFEKLMREAKNVDDAVRIIRNTVRTCSYVYLITDVKASDPAKKAVLVITDRGRVKVITQNTFLHDERDNDPYPAIENVVYGGARAKALYDGLMKNYGKITPETLMALTKQVSLKSNMQNVVFDPELYEAWVSNASMRKGNPGKAANQAWGHYRFKEALERH